MGKKFFFKKKNTKFMILSLLIDCSILNHFIKYPDLSLIENVENELRKRQQSSSIVEKLITTITNSFKTEFSKYTVQTKLKLLVQVVEAQSISADSAKQILSFLKTDIQPSFDVHDWKRDELEPSLAGLLPLSSALIVALNSEKEDESD